MSELLSVAHLQHSNPSETNFTMDFSCHLILQCNPNIPVFGSMVRIMALWEPRFVPRKGDCNRRNQFLQFCANQCRYSVYFLLFYLQGSCAWHSSIYIVECHNIVPIVVHGSILYLCIIQPEAYRDFNYILQVSYSILLEALVRSMIQWHTEYLIGNAGLCVCFM